jgi:hypothetical protein
VAVEPTVTVEPTVAVESSESVKSVEAAKATESIEVVETVETGFVADSSAKTAPTSAPVATTPTSAAGSASTTAAAPLTSAPAPSTTTAAPTSAASSVFPQTQDYTPPAAYVSPTNKAASAPASDSYTPSAAYVSPAAYTPPTYAPASAPASSVVKLSRNKFFIPIICVVAVLLVAGGITAGILIGGQQRAQTPTGVPDAVQASDQGEENPGALEDEAGGGLGDVVADTPPLTPRLNESELNAIINNSGASGNLSVAVFDLTDGQVYLSTNARNPYQASALIDIPIYYTLYRERLAGNLSFSDYITFHHSVSGRGILTAEQDGEQMSISSLLDTMFCYSDNNATNTFIDYLGLDKINQTCSENGYASVRIERPIVLNETTRDNYLSAFDLASMLDEIYSNAEDKRFLESYFFLDDSLARRGLGAAVPGSDIFMNLNGFITDKYNEVAIVARPKSGSNEGLYIVAFLGTQGEWERSADVAKALGDYIYANLG